MSGTDFRRVLSPRGWTRMARTSRQIAPSRYMCLSCADQSKCSLSYSCLCWCLSSSTWVPKGDYIASNTDECTATLSYAVSLKKPGTVSFEYFYPDNSIYFEFFVSVLKMACCPWHRCFWRWHRATVCCLSRFRMTSVSLRTQRAGWWSLLRGTGANTRLARVQLHCTLSYTYYHLALISQRIQTSDTLFISVPFISLSLPHPHCTAWSEHRQQRALLENNNLCYAGQCCQTRDVKKHCHLR